MDMRGNKRYRGFIYTNDPTRIVSNNKYNKMITNGLERRTLSYITTEDPSYAGHDPNDEECELFGCSVCYLRACDLAHAIPSKQRCANYVIKPYCGKFQTFSLIDLFKPSGLLYDHRIYHKQLKKMNDSSTCIDAFLNAAKKILPGERIMCEINEYDHICNTQVIEMGMCCDNCEKLCSIKLEYVCGCGKTHYCSKKCCESHREHDDDHNESIMSSN